MYGQPLNPKRTSFAIHDWDGDNCDFAVFLTDMDDESNDDVREVDHPDWEDKFDNAMENVFEPKDAFLFSRKNCKQYLLSLGMTEDED